MSLSGINQETSKELDDIRKELSIMRTAVAILVSELSKKDVDIYERLLLGLRDRESWAKSAGDPSAAEVLTDVENRIKTIFGFSSSGRAPTK